MIKKILIALTLIYSFNAHSADAVFTCQMKENASITQTGTNLNSLEGFTFRKTSREVIFGQGGYFSNHKMNVVMEGNDYFEANNINDKIIYSNGYFVYSSIGNNEKYIDVIGIIAYCNYL
jgi:hypothetical protein